jgi:hypothetical protein
VNPAGIVLGVAGVWVLCQVFGGNALTRLNIVPADSAGSSTGTGLGAVVDGIPKGLPGGQYNPPNWWDIIPLPGLPQKVS